MSAKAIIRWIPRERGGRTSPPDGRYRGTARFEDSRDTWPAAVWSLVVDPVRLVAGDPRTMLAKLEFLLPGGPTEMLTEGVRFELCEGRRVVAKGVILPPKAKVPNRINRFALSLLG